MQPASNAELIKEFFEKGLGARDLAVVDRVFVDTHVLRSPAIGTEAVEGTDFIKGVIEDFWSTGEVSCTVEEQVSEGEVVATSYTLGEAEGYHQGIMISHFADGQVAESLIVARDISGPVEYAARSKDAATRRKVFN